ncbi:MAG: hypothetical protein ACP5IY_07730, partial [Halothiobacillaceae bacterium]
MAHVKSSGPRFCPLILARLRTPCPIKKDDAIERWVTSIGPGRASYIAFKEILKKSIHEFFQLVLSRRMSATA